MKRFGQLAIMLVMIAILPLGLAWEVAAESAVTTSAAADQQFTKEKEEIVIRDVEGLRLQLEQKDQHPGNNSIRLNLKIISAINSDRVVLSWSVEGVSLFSQGEGYEELNLKAGDVVTKSIEVTPTGYGVTRVRAQVEAFEIDGTRVAIASKAIFSTEEGKLFFPSDSQKITDFTYFARNGATILLVIILVITLFFLLYRAFSIWLNSDDKR